MSRRTGYVVSGMLACLPVALACSGPSAAAPPDGAPSSEGRPSPDATPGPDAGASPFATRLVSFEPGPGAGFGQDELPDVVLGPPRGGGHRDGSLDVVALGQGGTITLELGVRVVDGPGADLLVFENAFRYGASTFAEPATVGLSEEGETFVEFPCDADDAPGFPGCAGREPVLANPDTNDRDPTHPAEAGGDAFDLADIPLARARYVRIRDDGRSSGVAGPDQAGFDLDAVAVVHGE